ncbi:class III extradiol dioxygenase subunit B-like domain-containing protein [Actinopolyspora sp. H202]|uniref:class III extradiol dioxygenase subunit B-like domain-containing protein n=1 Tax=Actinopolyspora sp. H202 TaxID=1500456 RepID=UPI003EE5F5D4
MLVAAGVFPQPPVLVPGVAGRRTADLDGTRANCALALTRLFDADPDLVVVLGGDDHTACHDSDVTGTLTPYGPDTTFGEGSTRLPLSLTIGRWLLEPHLDRAACEFNSVAWNATPAECFRLGERIADRAARVALLVLGDGSACRTERSPGFLEPDAIAYDDHIAEALRGGDTTALAALRPETAERLMVAGRPAWQVLAGAASERSPVGELLDYSAPYGVGYFVASWRFAGSSPRSGRPERDRVEISTE